MPRIKIIRLCAVVLQTENGTFLIIAANPGHEVGKHLRARMDWPEFMDARLEILGESFHVFFTSHSSLGRGWPRVCQMTSVLSRSSLSQVGQRMAFHGGIIRGGKILCTQEELVAWRKRLSQFIDADYRRLDRGELPRRPTIQEVCHSAEEGISGEDTECAPSHVPS